jgi:hypothetical protein
MTQAIFAFKDFNGTEVDAVAEIRGDAFGEGFYVRGDMGCGKTRPTIQQALAAYLGGREVTFFTTAPEAA